jgi:putative two-component system response regulator
MGSTNSPVLRLAAVIAATHHEKWDGTDYPKGLAGNAIPIEGRIVAVADVFDALSSARPYKEAFPIDRCLKILIDSRGKHFDPRVLDAFLRRKDEAIRVREDYVDFERDDIL